MLDAADARRVAGLLGIPFYVLNFEQDFGRVIDYFVDEYNRGRTPNPCVRCNDWLKFGKLTQYAKAVGADYVASGHYARVEPDPATGRRRLLRGRDHKKDQSYVLFGITPRGARPHAAAGRRATRSTRSGRWPRSSSSRCSTSPTRRRSASSPTRTTPASSAGGRRTRFGRGELVTAGGDGRSARHEGHQHFTSASGRGFGSRSAGRSTSSTSTRPPTASRVGDKADLARTSLVAPPGQPVGRPAVGRRAAGAVRGQDPVQPRPAAGRRRGDRRRRAAVRFDDPQYAVTPGQAVVLYDGDAVLGGGWID